MPSSVIRGWTYDGKARRLAITFVSGDIYAYAGVTPELVEAFRAASSKGRFFAARIRDRFAFDRIHIAVPD